MEVTELFGKFAKSAAKLPTGKAVEFSGACTFSVEWSGVLSLTPVGHDIPATAAEASAVSSSSSDFRGLNGVYVDIDGRVYLVSVETTDEWTDGTDDPEWE